MTTALEDLKAKQKEWREQSDAPGCGCPYCDGLREKASQVATEIQLIIKKLEIEIRESYH